MMNNLLFQQDRTRERMDLVSRTDFVQPLTAEQRRVLDLLRRHMGYSRAITIREIGKRLGMTAREIKERVQELRRDPFGLPICASRNGEHGGYYMAATEEERRHAGELLMHQIASMTESAKHLLEPHEMRAALTGLLQRVEGGDRG